MQADYEESQTAYKRPRSLFGLLRTCAVLLVALSCGIGIGLTVVFSALADLLK